MSTTTFKTGTALFVGAAVLTYPRVVDGSILAFDAEIPCDGGDFMLILTYYNASNIAFAESDTFFISAYVCHPTCLLTISLY